MSNRELKKLKAIFKTFPRIKLAYLFGSKATGKESPLSDYDFAFYLDEKNKQKMYDIKFALIDKISRLLKTDGIDVVILNLTESPEMKYQIIKDGKIIFERKPFKVLIEPRILNEYFDFHDLLLKYNLTKAWCRGFNMTNSVVIENKISAIKKYLKILSHYKKYSQKEIVSNLDIRP